MNEHLREKSDPPVVASDERVAPWFEALKSALGMLREERTTREKAVLITMLEQCVAYAWLWIVRK